MFTRSSGTPTWLASLADLLFVEVPDGETVDRTVAVLGVVARERLASVPGAEHDPVLVVRDEVPEHRTGSDSDVADRGSERIRFDLVVIDGFGEGIQKGVDNGFDGDHVVLDPEVLGDALGVAHVVVVVDLARHHESVQPVGAEGFHREVGREGAVDTAREPQDAALCSRVLGGVGDEFGDSVPRGVEFVVGEREVERCVGADDRFGVGHDPS